MKTFIAILVLVPGSRLPRPPAIEVLFEYEHHRVDEDDVSVVLGLWDARGIIVAIVLTGLAFFHVCRRWPLLAWFLLEFIQGLTNRRRRRW